MVLQAWAGAKEASPLPLSGAGSCNLPDRVLHVQMEGALI